MRRYIKEIPFILLLISALMLRCHYLGFESSDYTDGFGQWYDYLKAHGIGALKVTFSNYSTSYLLLLYIATLFIVWQVIYFAFFACDIGAVVWTGMWFGLTSKKESQAITKTIVYVLIAPFLALPICGCAGIAVFSLGSIFWMVWAKNRLETDFRAYATGRQPPSYLRPEGTLLPVPPFTRPSPPLPPIQG